MNDRNTRSCANLAYRGRAVGVDCTCGRLIGLGLINGSICAAQDDHVSLLLRDRLRQRGYVSQIDIGTAADDNSEDCIVKRRK